MIRSLDRLVKAVGILIVPIAVVLFVQQFHFRHQPLSYAVTSTAAAIIGMIPEGLYLLASVAMAVSAMRLARSKVLVHSMKSIETLARVDVLCVDIETQEQGLVGKPAHGPMLAQHLVL